MNGPPGVVARPATTAMVSAFHRATGISVGQRTNDGVVLRYAGGREVTLRDLQSMGMTAGINALIVGNYLTTLGRTPAEDLQMLEDLRMPVGALTTAF